MDEAIKDGTGMTIDGLRQDGRPVPSPHASSTYVDIPA